MKQSVGSTLGIEDPQAVASSFPTAHSSEFCDDLQTKSNIKHDPPRDFDRLQAICRGNLEDIKRLIDKTNVNGVMKNCGKMKATSIYYAAERGDPSILTYLIDIGGQLERRASTGMTALMVACENGHLEACQVLLNRGANANRDCRHSSRGKSPPTPLMLACRYGHLEISEIFVANGANIHVKDRVGRTAIFHAASEGHGQVVQCLINNGAMVDGEAPDRVSPLITSCWNGHKETTKILLENGANINATYCNKSGYIAKLLPDQSFLQKRYTDIEVGSALSVACRNEHWQLAQFLIGKGADVRQVQWGRGRSSGSPLQMAARSGSEDTVSLILTTPLAKDEIPLEMVGVFQRFSCPDRDKEEALLEACALGHEAVCRALIRHGTDVNYFKMRSNYQSSPLLAACRNGHGTLVDLLIENGVSVNAPLYDRRAAISVVIADDSLAATKMLLERGADVDAVDERVDRDTPLIAAAGRGNKDIIKLLLSLRLKTVNYVNNAGLSALQTYWNDMTRFNAKLSVIVDFLRAGAVFSCDPFLKYKTWYFLICKPCYFMEMSTFCDLTIELRGKSSFHWDMYSEFVSEVLKAEFVELAPNFADNHVLRHRFPRPLQAICRTTIVKRLPEGLTTRQEAVSSLRLPVVLEGYLNFAEHL